MAKEAVASGKSIKVLLLEKLSTGARLREISSIVTLLPRDHEKSIKAEQQKRNFLFFMKILSVTNTRNPPHRN
jgi:hypothetical protein